VFMKVDTSWPRDGLREPAAARSSAALTLRYLAYGATDGRHPAGR
jgi:hypothetical protein